MVGSGTTNKRGKVKVMRQVYREGYGNVKGKWQRQAVSNVIRGSVQCVGSRHCGGQRYNGKVAVKAGERRQRGTAAGSNMA